MKIIMKKQLLLKALINITDINVNNILFYI